MEAESFRAKGIRDRPRVSAGESGLLCRAACGGAVSEELLDAAVPQWKLKCGHARDAQGDVMRRSSK
jgi:hypothetical protein